MSWNSACATDADAIMRGGLHVVALSIALVAELGCINLDDHQYDYDREGFAALQVHVLWVEWKRSQSLLSSKSSRAQVLGLACCGITRRCWTSADMRAMWRPQ